AALVFSYFSLTEYYLFITPDYLRIFMLDHYWAYLAFTVFAIVGGANATNLTDGLDGLLAGTAVISFAAFGWILHAQYYSELAAVPFIICGSLLGFLIFNFSGKIFMGDVGSLPPGAVLAGLAVMTHNELVLVIISLLFIMEALSVIIQVISYKLYKKRVFRMSPLHHHFELLGWHEKKVVLVFWGAALFFALIGIMVG
ncbi:phospho-N-acetylmuramoyl-pentapeptide-transferase, partial [Candidatus Margulisiibacteriota bacterium]